MPYGMDGVRPTPPTTAKAGVPFCPSFRKQHYKEIPVPPKDIVYLLPYRTDSFYSRYFIGKELGQGQFGVVRECMNKETGDIFACKTLAKKSLQTPDEKSDVLREIKLLENLSTQRSVVSLQDVFEDAENLHIVMELCKGGELYEVLVKRVHFSELESATLFKALATAVAECHSAGVLHRDLKPENILLTKKFGQEGCEVKLADFGLAVLLNPGQKVEGVAGSPFYLAPETMAHEYGFAADVWSMGIILYIFICGSAPFHGHTDLETVKLAASAPLDFSDPLWRTVHPSVIGLVMWCLDKDPERRPSVADILQHPWVRAFGRDTVPTFAPEPQAILAKNIFDTVAGSDTKVGPLVNPRLGVAEAGGPQQDSRPFSTEKRGAFQCTGSPRSPFDLWERTFSKERSGSSSH